MLYSFIKTARSRLLVFLTHHLALPLLRHFRRPRPFPYSQQELAAFPTGSLGADLYQLLKEKDLVLLTHYARHDLKHILLGYDTTEEGEVCLQTFMLANGRVSFPVLATVLYGFFTMPEHWLLFKAAWKRGRSCPPLHHWNWFGLLHEKTAVLQNCLFNTSNSTAC